MKKIRYFNVIPAKLCVESTMILYLVHVLLTLTGCTTPPAASNMTAEPAAPSVMIIIYTDFQCGACERFYTQVEPELKARYIVTGKAKSETRLVGVLGPESMRAAEAALCAADQGVFEEYTTALFESWREIDGEAYSEQELIDIARTLGLDKQALQQCLDSGNKRHELQKNLKTAESEGVHTLPAVFIGEMKIEGNKRLEVYIRTMDQTLARLSQ